MSRHPSSHDLQYCSVVVALIERCVVTSVRVSAGQCRISSISDSVLGRLQTNDTIDITDRISPVIDQGFRFFATGAYYRSFISRTGIRNAVPISPQASSSPAGIINSMYQHIAVRMGNASFLIIRSLYLPAKLSTSLQPMNIDLIQFLIFIGHSLSSI